MNLAFRHALSLQTPCQIGRETQRAAQHVMTAGVGIEGQQIARVDPALNVEIPVDLIGAVWSAVIYAHLGGPACRDQTTGFIAKGMVSPVPSPMYEPDRTVA